MEGISSARHRRKGPILLDDITDKSRDPAAPGAPSGIPSNGSRWGTWGMLETLTQRVERETLDPAADLRDPSRIYDLAQHAVECLGSFCRATRASLYLREPDGRLSLAASSGNTPPLPKAIPQFSHDSPTLMAQVLRSGNPLFLDDVARYRKQLGWSVPSYARGRQDPSCIVLPLINTPGIVGDRSAADPHAVNPHAVNPYAVNPQDIDRTAHPQVDPRQEAHPPEASPTHRTRGVINFSELRSPPPGEGSVRRHALIHGAHLVALGMRLRSSLEALEARASRDGLTHLFNYKTFYETLGREVFRAERYDSRLSLILFDIDRFKSINDRFGHLAGDAILTELARRLGTALRNADVAARYAGDEFAVILPETTLSGAIHVAERVREAVAKESFAYLQSPIEVTISLGVAQLSTGMTAVDLVNSADRQLYQAKDRGRNCVAADL